MPAPLRTAVAHDWMSLGLTVAFVGSLILAPLMLPLSYKNLSERGIEPGDAQSTITIGRPLGLQGFLVSQQGGKDERYFHFSVAELDDVLTSIPATNWTGAYKERVATDGSVALFIAYAAEFDAIGYFMGPAEIVTRTDDVVWRATLSPEPLPNRLRVITSVTPIPKTKN